MTDIFLTEVGDIKISPTGDIEIAESMDEITQSISVRCKCDAGELILHPDIGMSLSQLVGKMMTPAILKQGEEIIKRNITYDGLLTQDRIKVSSVPLDKENCLFIIEILGTDLQREMAVSIPFDINAGVNLTGVKAIGSESLYSL